MIENTFAMRYYIGKTTTGIDTLASHNAVDLPSSIVATCYYSKVKETKKPRNIVPTSKLVVRLVHQLVSGNKLINVGDIACSGKLGRLLKKKRSGMIMM